MKPFFFYGSLMQGYWNNKRIMERAKDWSFIGPAEIKGFQLFIGARGIVPCIWPSTSSQNVVLGELWTVDDGTALAIHALERGYEAMDVLGLGEAEQMRATTFVCDPATCQYIDKPFGVVESGNYRDVVGANRLRIDLNSD